MGHQKLKTVQKHLFQRRIWSRIIFEKSHLFAPTRPWTLLTHLGIHLFVLELAACRRLVGLGIGVYASDRAIPRGGNHKKWGVAGGVGALGIAF